MIMRLILRVFPQIIPECLINEIVKPMALLKGGTSIGANCNGDLVIGANGDVDRHSPSICANGDRNWHSLPHWCHFNGAT